MNKLSILKTLKNYMHALTHACRQTILWFLGICLGQHRWAGTRRNVHPLTSFMVISHPLSTSSISY